MRRTELFLFESEYGRRAFERKLGKSGALARVVHNGVGPVEFTPILPAPEATDLVFVGELRTLKGVDVLIEAIAVLMGRGKRITATVVGDGPDRGRSTTKVNKPAGLPS
jgi:glycosyltransferase involved in cell wall biosynthesis